MWIVDRDALEREIDKRGAVIDALVGPQPKTRDLSKALEAARLLAEHDALVVVFSCLRERKSIWDDVNEPRA